MQKHFLLSIILALQFCQLHAQLKGKVTDSKSEPLPFVNVYVQNTTYGTTTNSKGEYQLNLAEGTHQVVFQFIGYKQRTESIEVPKKGATLDVVLQEEAIELSGVEVRANAEDPAYPIIRKAIEKREYYLRQIEEYTCEVYIKGNVKLLEVPKKLLGQDVGDLDGMIDTTGQGIVYLSESVSTLHVRQPDKVKEVMQSSKVSGNNQGFSYNSAQDMDVNLYRNHTKLGRNMVSPIAESAMNFYKYRLEGAFVDEEGRLVNKIEIIPKNGADPVFRGHIYIISELWNVYSADLYTTGMSAQQPIFDTLRIKQHFVPVAKPDVWRLFSQTFSMKGGLLGFKFGGSFTGIYRNYNLKPNLPKGFFDNEIMKVEKGANEKDSSFWNNTRPVPLTQEEFTDYLKKDSIRLVRESKPFMDSLDREGNKPEWGDLLFGYTWQNSWERRSWTLESPINTFQYNLVQGVKLNLGLRFAKRFNKEGSKNFSIGSRVSYGIADQKLRATGDLTWRYNPKIFAQVRLSGGQDVVQFNELDPISTMLNTYFTLFNRYNYGRFFEKDFVKIDYQREVANGILLYSVVQWANRSALENRTNYSLFYKNKRDFEPNLPETGHLSETSLLPSQASTVGISVRLRPGQRYMDYPDRKYVLGSKFPDIWLHYRKGLRSIGSSDVDFDRISLAVSKNEITMGTWGAMRFRFEAGKFLNASKLYFQDWRHFLGNETRIGNKDYYMNAFKMLPYYAYSTSDAWFQGNWEHDFRGKFTDKIPGLKKLGWNLVAGANFLYTSEAKDYAEVSLGFDGLTTLRLFRVDVVASFERGKYQGIGYIVGMSLPLEELQL